MRDYSFGNFLHELRVRRGVYAGKGMPAEIRGQLLAIGAEEWVVESFEKIRYLFPRANSILRVKHAMILMWYKLHYPEVFDKIIFNGNVRAVIC